MEFHSDLDNSSELEAFGQLLSIVEKLREECPWDRKQTMESLRYLTIEETFELSEAILENNTEDIREELGDLLLHIVSYARIASEQHSFTIAKVIQALCAKLIHRHPHIYDQEKAENEKVAGRAWARLKLKEKENKSVLGGVPRTLPSLIKAMRIQEKTSMVGFDWGSEEETREKIKKGIQAIVHPDISDSRNLEDAFGEVLLTLVHHAKLVGINAEDALEKANKKFIQSFQRIEQQITKQGEQITQLSTQELMDYWKETKQQVVSE
jgi:MazG family protein